MKTILTSLFFIFSIQLMYSQLPMKQDSVIGTKKMKSLMTNNGFTFYKANEYPKRNGIKKTLNLLYKEEVEVDIYYNDFNNIESIAIRTGNDKIIDKIKKIVGFDKWTYAYTEEKNFEKNDVYKLNDYYCQFAYRPHNRDYANGNHIVYQFLNYY
tara:strand:+ start:551 stop:1015 length:465 start_codon:yes stop_codon:yes gene_type:complete